MEETLNPAILSVQVGKFYEVMGFDAIVLAEIMGRNFAGYENKTKPYLVPRAGEPCSGIHNALRTLVQEHNFMAVSLQGIQAMGV